VTVTVASMSVLTKMLKDDDYDKKNLLAIIFVTTLMDARSRSRFQIIRNTVLVALQRNIEMFWIGSMTLPRKFVAKTPIKSGQKSL
jgi:hypothetical protein